MKRSSLLSFFIIALISVGMILAFLPVPAKATTPIVSAQPPVQLSTASTVMGGGNFAFEPTGEQSCWMTGQSAWVIAWPETTTQFDYSYSTDGLTWTTKAALYTTANALSGTGLFTATCFSSSILVTWHASGDKTARYVIVSLATIAMPSVTTSETTVTGSHLTSSTLTCLSSSYDVFGNFWQFFASSASPVLVAKNGAWSWNTTTTFDGNIGCGDVINYGSNSILTVNNQPGGGSANFYGTGLASGATKLFSISRHLGGISDTFPNFITGTGGECITSDTCIFMPAGTAAAATGGQCYIEVYDITVAGKTEYTPSGIPAALCGYTQGYGGFEAADGTSNVWMIFGTKGSTGNAAPTLMASSDGGGSWAATTYNSQFAGTTVNLYGMEGIVTVKGQLQALLIESVGNTGIYVQVLTTGSQTVGPTAQTQTIGSCPPGGGTGIGHFALANSTQYWYSGNALGQEAVNTIQTEVSSIKGSGSHTLQLLIYVTASNPNAQAPSVNYPAILAYSQSFVITSGTTNNTITLQVSIPLNTANLAPLPFNFWAVGIVGDDHINIAGSSVSGLRTQTGAASTATQPNSFTSIGTTSTNKLALCATGSYQSFFIGTTTTTAQASTTTTASTTVTSTISTIGATLFTTSSNWPVIFLILLLPAGLFLGVTKSLAGAILGLIVGAVVGELMGILPSFVFIGLVISLVAIAFVVRDRSGNG